MTPQQCAAELRGMGRAIDRPKLREAMAQCENALQAGFAKNFMLSQTADEEKWPPRKDPIPTHPLLILSGTLLDSVTSENARYHVRRITDDSLETGTNLAYAATHEYGDPSRNIAQRAYLDVPEGVLDECEDIIADALLGQMLGG